MQATVDRVRGALSEHGSKAEIVELSQDAPTAAATAQQLGCEVGAIANSLVFNVGGDALLVVTSGAHRVDTRRLARLLGVGRDKVRRAQPEFVLAATGQEVGGVAPIGHPVPLRTFVDVWLERHPQVWTGAGLPHTVFATTYQELLDLTHGEPADIGEQD